VPRLALVGCTEAQIGSITGHGFNDVRSILEAHYLRELARAAIHRLELGCARRGIIVGKCCACQRGHKPEETRFDRLTQQPRSNSAQKRE